MPHYSRAQISQITKRAKMTKFKFDRKWKCLICGHNLRFSDCNEHDEAENLAALELVKPA